MILWGLALAPPAGLTVANLFYALDRQADLPDSRAHRRWLDSGKGRSGSASGSRSGRKGATTSNSNTFDDEAGLPSAFQAFAPIIVPLVLIFANAYLGDQTPGAGGPKIFLFLGSPIIAVAIGLFAGHLSSGRQDEPQDIIKVMEDGIRARASSCW